MSVMTVSEKKSLQLKYKSYQNGWGNKSYAAYKILGIKILKYEKEKNGKNILHTVLLDKESYQAKQALRKEALLN